MKKINILFRSFQAKLTAALILSMFFAAAMSNFLVYRYALDSQFNELKEKLRVIAQTAALMVEAEVITQVPLTRDGINSLQYRSISQKLEKIKQVNTPIKYIYTLTKTEIPGIWQFIVDPEPATKTEKRKGITSYPGDRYNASRFPEMLKAFDSPSADNKLEVDEWGVTLSGYAPIRDKDGKPVAILGVDIAADDVYKAQKEVHRRAVIILLLGIIVSICLGLFISKRITKPISSLVKGIQHISKGDLHYLVEVKGEDEISELAESFNRMAKNLSESRRKLYSYFYRTVHSLARILEARDPYTRGHSDRVAGYAEAIASIMGFSQDKIELLKDAAYLHDIGKLGIQESILNKKEKLTPEEHELIRKHPIIGEEILRPVILNGEMLAIVRGHHEHYDSNGYPDKMGGENINILAAIISVADAYDAMTSPRAYRPALTKKKAMEELKNNKGSQFNPKVVDIFIRVLEKEI